MRLAGIIGALSLGTLSIGACGGATPEPHRPTVAETIVAETIVAETMVEGAETLVEAPSPEPAQEVTAEPATAGPGITDAPSTDAPTDPEPPRVCSAEVSTALDALFTPGNRWRYREFSGWHSDTSEHQRVDEQILSARVVGEMRVAVIERRVTPWFEPGETVEQRAVQRIQNADGTWRVTCLAPDAEWTEADLREAIRRCGEAETSSATTSPRPLCAAFGCGTFESGGRTIPDYYEPSFSLWPGVGIVAWSLGGYSAESGDGQTQHRSLVSFDLVSSASSVGALGDEPADFRRMRRRVHQRAGANDVARLSRLLSPEVQYSLNLEHRWRRGALTAWAADDGRAMQTLTRITSDACRSVGSDVICPAAEAERMSAISGCLFAETPSGPRALFTREDSHWVLASFLLGGQDDVFSAPSSNNEPTLPDSLRSR